MFSSLYKNPTKSAYSIISVLGIFSLFYNAIFPLHGDEAYYWMWSHHLEAGYYDHPAMIAYMIHLTNFISQSSWGVRLSSVIGMSITSIYIFKLTALLSDKKTALNAIIIFSSVALTHAGYIFATPDAPLILFWTLSLYYAYQVMFRGKLRDFIFTGIFLGLLMMSKYSAILLVIALLLFIFIKRRDLLTNGKTYITIFIALLIITPMLYWNYQHDWISFLFQFNHGTTHTFEIKPSLTLEFIASQFGLFSPVFAWILFYYGFKEKFYYKDEKLFFLSLSTFVILFFFLYKSFYLRMSPSYSGPAYVSGVILVALSIKKYDLRKSFKIGLIIAIVMTLIARIILLTNLKDLRPLMYGTQRAVERFYSHAQPHDHFYGAHLTTAAYLKYYLPGHPDTDVAIDSRYSQYDMWRKPNSHKNGLVLARTHKRYKELKKYYNNVKLIDTYVLVPKRRVFYTYRVSDPK